jgi:hypothetical protein
LHRKAGYNYNSPYIGVVMTDQELIAKLGGVGEVAKLVGISSPAASYWKRKGIPKLRLMQLKMLKPEFFDDVQAIQQATAPASDSGGQPST